MKREIFDKIIETIKPLYLKNWQDKSLQHNVKVIDNETFISYYFDETTLDRKKDIEYAKNVFKESGWKHPRNSDVAMHLSHKFLKSNVFCVLYNKVKDSISISYFSHGYAYSYKKERFYPVKINTPILCYSKHVYCFAKHSRNGIGGPRILRGFYIPVPYNIPIMKCILNIPYEPTVDRWLAREFMNTTSEVEIVEKKYGVKIPKLLIESFRTTDLDILAKVLKNPGEMNTICQFILKRRKEDEENKKTEINRPNNYKIGLWRDNKFLNLSLVLSQMCFNTDREHWLIKDWLEDHYKLDKKFSIKISSVTRMRDEHEKLSRERILQGIKNVKMHDLYKGLFKDFSIPVEEVADKKRLLQESLEQRHCVATYADRINSGGCGIFSMVFKDVRYTLEVNKLLEMTQLQGYRNGAEGHNPPEELKDMITNHLKEYKAARVKDIKNITQEHFQKHEEQILDI